VVKLLREYVLLCALLVIGCQDEREQPSFLDRSYQDCQNGDEQACKMLSDLQQPVEQHKPTPRKPTAVQMNVKAMIEGIERARSAPTSKKYQDTAPSIVPQTDQPTVPVDP
jgi:hypothetical protein